MRLMQLQLRNVDTEQIVTFEANAEGVIQIPAGTWTPVEPIELTDTIEGTTSPTLEHHVADAVSGPSD